MNIILLIIFALMPSLIWLSYYLKKDVHPEPKRMVLKIFICGMIITVPAAFLGIAFSYFFNKLSYSFYILPSPEQIDYVVKSSSVADLPDLNLLSFLFFFIYLFVGVALVEEFFKYFVVRCEVLNNPEFDEPIDAMIYMIIAGLGFAALENILYLSFLSELNTILTVNIMRFLGAVLLHALWSATFGFFLALAIFEKKHKFKLFLIGLLTATLLHASFNYSIMILSGWLQLFIPILIIISLALFVSFGFQKLKKMKSVCKI